MPVRLADLPLSKCRSLKLANGKPSVKQLDALARDVVRARDKVCRVCGGKDYLQAAHFITRSNRAVRWDLDNLFLLCAGDHAMRNTSWHKDPGGCTDFVKKALGAKRYQSLRMRAATVGQKIDLWAVKLYLEQERLKNETAKGS